MNNFLIFNGRPSRDFGIYISGSGTFGAPKRKFEEFTVPGRNGVLKIDSGTFENASVSYKCAIVQGFAQNAAALRAWLLSPAGYCRLEDTYHPDEFRMAHYSSGVDFTDFTQLLRAASVTLTFDCKPQRFLKSGENPIYNPVKIYNPTSFPAKPLIKFKMTAASGSVAVGECNIAISGMTIGDIITIDAETMDAVGAFGGNANNGVTITGGMELHPQTYATVSSSGITDLTITPRWWII